MAIWDRKKATDERQVELTKFQQASQFGKKIVNKVVCAFTGEQPK